MPSEETTSIPPRRIRIVGASGSGKTTLARLAAARLGVGHLELDEAFWDSGWRFRDVDEARASVRSFVEEHPEGWVVDGNWSTRLDGMLDPDTPDGADLVVWLDHSRLRTVGRVVRRTLWRGLTRQELWHGNRERPWTWLTPRTDDNIMLFAWRQHPSLRARFAEHADDPRWRRLSGQPAVEAWLASLRPVG